MKIVDEVICKAKDLADVAGKKTGELVSLTKLKIEIAENNRAIETKMKEIGGTVYAAHTSGEDCTVTLEELFEEIAALEEAGAALAAKMDDLRSTKTCASCGKNSRSDAAFCQTCGEKF